MAGLRRALVALAAALALADASIVALALPPILAEMDTTITGVAAVVGVYALVLALGILPAARFDARRAGFWGLALFAVASLGCGLANSLGVLLLFRALQAAGGAAALLAAFQVLDAGQSRSGRRLWLGAALVGTAAGPAIGGLLTEVFDWRAIFFVQAPLAAAAALACLRPARAARAVAGARPAPARTRSPKRRPRRPEPRREAPDGGLWSRRDAPAAARPGGARGVGASRARRCREPAMPAGRRGRARRRPVAPPGRRASTSRRPRPGVGRRPADVAPRAPDRRRHRARSSTTTSARARRAARPPVRVGRRLARQRWPRSRFTAAAFTAVLFLLVIELVAGFAISPLRAALGVTILPLAALAAAAIPGPARPRALAGAVLLAGGAAALAFLPAPSIAWTVVPQLLAGAGMGLALPAYAGELLPEKTVGEAAVALVARHAGIVVVLAILAPVATAKLESGTDQAILQGAALVLDAQIDPLQKLELAPALLEDVDIDSPRAGADRRGRPPARRVRRRRRGLRPARRSGSTTSWSSPSRTRSRSST